MVSIALRDPSKTRLLASALLGWLGLVLLLAGCGQDPNQKPLDTPTSGEMTIATDESFLPIVQAQVDVFQYHYPRTKIHVVSMPEDEAFRALLKDSVRLVIASRDLNNEELKYFEEVKIKPSKSKFAVDGVALIVSKNNPDSLITTRQLEKVFSGQAKTWSDLRPGASGKKIVVVFDNNGSSNLNFITRRFSLKDLSHLEIFAAKSNKEVIEYVRKNDNAIGVIGTNWVSDSDDPTQQKFTRDVTVMSVSELNNPTLEDYYQPYQAYLAQRLYPLRRDVMAITREARTGLANGLMSHMASVRGQRIVQKSGLLPATMPVRIVGLKKDSL